MSAGELAKNCKQLLHVQYVHVLECPSAAQYGAQLVQERGSSIDEILPRTASTLCTCKQVSILVFAIGTAVHCGSVRSAQQSKTQSSAYIIHFMACAPGGMLHRLTFVPGSSLLMPLLSTSLLSATTVAKLRPKRPHSHSRVSPCDVVYVKQLRLSGTRARERAYVFANASLGSTVDNNTKGSH
jgi:hypothetical protein